MDLKELKRLADTLDDSGKRELTHTQTSSLGSIH